MCWMLTVAGPPAATELPGLFRTFGEVVPEPVTIVLALFGPGDMCRRIGAGCACSLYRAEAVRADSMRRKAARRGWPPKMLQRRLAQVGDWIGVEPAVRAAIAAAAERWGRVGVFLWWDDNSGRLGVTESVTVSPYALLVDAATVAPNRLVTVVRPHERRV